MSPDQRPVPQRLPAGSGFRWLLRGLALLRLQPARLLLIAMFLQLVLGLTQIPLLGLLVIIAVPGFSAGLLEALHVTANGGRPQLKTLFQPLATAPHSGRLLLVGALVFAVGLVSMSVLLSGSDQLTDPAMLQRIEQGDLEALSQVNQDSLRQIALAFLVGVGISGTLSYFTIPLVWFGGQGVAAALGTGLRALTINWKPFLVLGLGMLLLVVPVGLVSGALFALGSAGSILTTLAMGFVLILLLAFQLMLFSTQYLAFRDIFSVPAVPPSGPADDGQLVA